jgi:putative flippase GtrA
MIARMLWRHRFIRFLAVGGFNTVVGYSIFAAFIFLRVPYPLAALLATVVSVLINFRTYGELVFDSRDNRKILRFIAVYAVCYAVGLGPLAWAKAHGIPVLLMAALSALPMTTIGFVLNRKFVFASNP